MGDYSNPGETKWNFDDARMQVLHSHMIELEYAFENWNLKGIYTKLKTIEMIISGPLDDKEWSDINKKFKEFEDLKRKINDETNENLGKEQIKYYNYARNIYIELNRIMNKRGFFFRIREDIDGL